MMLTRALLTFILLGAAVVVDSRDLKAAAGENNSGASAALARGSAKDIWSHIKPSMSCNMCAPIAAGVTSSPAPGFPVKKKPKMCAALWRGPVILHSPDSAVPELQWRRLLASAEPFGRTRASASYPCMGTKRRGWRVWYGRSPPHASRLRPLPLRSEYLGLAAAKRPQVGNLPKGWQNDPNIKKSFTNYVDDVHDLESDDNSRHEDDDDARDAPKPSPPPPPGALPTVPGNGPRGAAELAGLSGTSGGGTPTGFTGTTPPPSMFRGGNVMTNPIQARAKAGRFR